MRLSYIKIALGAGMLAALGACNWENKASDESAVVGEPSPAADEIVSDAAADLLASDAKDAGAKESPASENKTWSANVVKTTDGYQVGNPQAKVTLVEYGARTCPACARFHSEAKQDLLKNYVDTGKVKYEYRNFMIHGLPDIAATLAAECAEPEKFLPILDEMYARQKVTMATLEKETDKARDELKKKNDVMFVVEWIGEKAGYIEILKKNGVPEAKVRQCLTNKARAQELVDLTKKAKDVKGTPAFYLDGSPMTDYQWADIKKKIDLKIK